MPMNIPSSVSEGRLVSTTAYASASALEAAFPAATNSGKLGLVGTVLYTSNGTAWTATGSSSVQTLRNVANCQIHSSANGSFKQAMCRAPMVNHSDVTQIKLLYGNYDSNINGSGATAQIRASIEYPVGVFTQVLFSGIATASVSNGAEVISDFVSVTIPKNTVYWIRTWWASAGSMLFIYSSSPAGVGFEFSATTQADVTMGGAVAGSVSGYINPYAVLAMSDKPSLFLAGDSRQAGVSDSAQQAGKFLACGEVARSLVSTVATINAGAPGANIASEKTAYAYRATIANRFCTGVISQYGINDVTNSSPAGTILANHEVMRDLFPTLPYWVCTLPPKSTSSDGFATTGNQTVDANNSIRVAYNNQIREFGYKFAGVIEIADAVESARDSGVWAAPGLTSDGLHENPKGSARIFASGVVNPGRFLGA